MAVDSYHATNWSGLVVVCSTTIYGYSPYSYLGEWWPLGGSNWYCMIAARQPYILFQAVFQ